MLGKRYFYDGWVLEEDKYYYTKLKKKDTQRIEKDKYSKIPLNVFHWKYGKLHTNVYNFHIKYRIDISSILSLLEGNKNHINHWRIYYPRKLKTKIAEIKKNNVNVKCVQLKHIKLGMVVAPIHEIMQKHGLKKDILIDLLLGKIEKYNKWTSITKLTVDELNEYLM